MRPGWCSTARRCESSAASALTRFDNATFRNTNPAVTPLKIDRPDGAVTFNSITFEVVPTTAVYLHLVDTNAGTPALTVTMNGTQPPNHGGFVLLQGGAQLLGWPL